MNPIAATAKPAKSTRLNIRATDDEKNLLEQAARHSRVTASQFVMQAALRSAEEVLAEQVRFTLPPDEWDAFVNMLDRPARTMPALTRAAAKPSPFSDR